MFVRHLATTSEAPVREADIRSIHQLILLRIDPGEAGRYSRHQRIISGSLLLLPSPAEIPALMGDFARWLEEAPAIPETAFTSHERLVTIHPFSDGNGRTGRLLMNLLLLRMGYPPVVIRPEDRPAYFDALEAVQIRGDSRTYLEFLSARLHTALDHHLQLLRRGLNAAPSPESDAAKAP